MTELEVEDLLFLALKEFFLNSPEYEEEYAISLNVLRWLPGWPDYERHRRTVNNIERMAMEKYMNGGEHDENIT